MKSLPSSSAYAGWLAVVRILTGVMWLAHAVPKFTKSDQFMPPNGFIVMYVSTGLAHTTGGYHAFLANIVLPNIALFAELVRLGELLAGISLLLGVFSRLGGLVGIVLTLDYISARGTLFSSATLQSIDFCMMVLSATALVLPTGRVFGIDAWLARPKRVAPAVVRAEFVPEPVAPAPPPPTSSTPENP